MQGDGRGSEEPSLLQLAGVSSCEELPPFCLLSSLFGESHTCGHDLPEEDQTTLFISDAVAKDNQDTSAMSEAMAASPLDTPVLSDDLKCIALSSTPFRKVSTPHDLSLDIDSADDWSITMATPTALRRFPVGLTPVITTTNEDMSDLERGISRSSVAHKPTNKPVARTLFTSRAESSPSSALDAHPLPHCSNAVIKKIHGKLLFSPICASPLLSSQHKQTHNCGTAGLQDTDGGGTGLQDTDGGGTGLQDTDGGGTGLQDTDGGGTGLQDASVSLISTHTIVETPTRPGKKRIARESVGLNKAFCDESGLQISCSQELFDSPETHVGGEERDGDALATVNSVPDSPVPHSVPHGEHTLVMKEGEDEEPRPPASHVDAAVIDIETEEMEDAPAISEVNKQLRFANTNEKTYKPSIVTSLRTVADSPTICETYPPVHQESLTKRRPYTTDTFLYPDSQQLSSNLHHTVGAAHTELSDIDCSVREPPLPQPSGLRGKRKRTASSSAAPPEKKPSTTNPVTMGCDVATHVADKSDPHNVASECRMDTVTTGECEAVCCEVMSSAPTESCVRESYSSSCLPDRAARDECDLKPEETVASVQCTSLRPLVGFGSSRAPGLRKTFTKKDGTTQPFVLPAGPEKAMVPDSMECNPPNLPPVGFTTASGLTLQISIRGMKKAQQLLADAENNERASDATTSTQHMTAPTEPAHIAVPDLGSSTFAGFQTASGHSFSISEEALQKARKFLCEEEHGSDKSPSGGPPTPLPTATPHLPPQSVLAGRKTEGGLTATPSAVGPRNVLSSGRPRGQRVARQSKPFKAPRLASSVSKEEESAKVAQLLRSMRRAGAGSDHPADSPLFSTPQVECGFSTGSGKKLRISASSFQRAQKLVTEDKENGISTDSVPDPSTVTTVSTAIPPLSCGFQAASGKGLKISAQAVEKARRLFAGIDNDDISTKSAPSVVLNEGADPNVGSSKQPELGEQHGQSFYTEEELGREDLTDFTDFTQLQFNHKASDTGSQTHGVMGEEEGDGNGERRIEQEEDHSTYLSTQVVKQFLNFSVEEEEDEGECGNQELAGSLPHSRPHSPLPPQSHQSTQHTPAPPSACDTVNEEASCHADRPCVSTDLPLSTTTVSDHCRQPEDTCSDATQHMSENGVAKEPCSSSRLQASSATLIDELFGVVDSEPCPTDPELHPALREQTTPVTASQRMTDVHVDGLSEVANLNTSTSVEAQHRPFRGLMTAGGRTVTVSESALSAARAALNTHPHLSPPPPTQPVSSTTHCSVGRDQQSPPGPWAGLQTASGRAVDVSEDALRAVKSLLDAGQPASCHPHQPRLGLQATSHTDALDESLIQDRTVVERQHVSPGLHTSFPGLQTAGGKKVHISGAALKAIRQADSYIPRAVPHEDRGSEDGNVPSSPAQQTDVVALQNLIKGGEGEIPVITGLQTARGGRVVVSRTALAAVRNSLDCTTTTSTAAGTTSSGTKVSPLHSSSAGEVAQVPRITPHLKVCATSSHCSVRYKPVFRGGYRTSSLPHRPGTLPRETRTLHHQPGTLPSTSYPTFTSADQHSLTRGLHSTPESVLCDRTPPMSRQPLTPMQTYLGPDGSYMATPVQRYHLRSLPSSRVMTGPPAGCGSCTEERRQEKKEKFNKDKSMNMADHKMGCTEGEGSMGHTEGESSMGHTEGEGSMGHTEGEGSMGHTEGEGSMGHTEGESSMGHTEGEGSMGHIEGENSMDHAEGEGSIGHTEGEGSMGHTEGEGSIGHTEGEGSVGHTEGEGSMGHTEGEGSMGRIEGEGSMGHTEGEGSVDKKKGTDANERATGPSSMCCAGRKSGDGQHEMEDSGAVSSSIEPHLLEGTERVAEVEEQEEGEEERQATCVRGYGVCALDQLNDSLEECSEALIAIAGDEVAEKSHTPIQSAKFSKPSKTGSTKRKQRLPTRSAGSLLTSRLQHSEARVPLADVPGCSVPGRFTEGELYEAGVHPATVRVNAENAATFQFSGELFFSSAVLDGAPVCVGDGAVVRLKEGRLGGSELWEGFAASPGVDRKLVSLAWFVNHYRWIVWKLAAMEVAFPARCAGRCLTPDWLMKQMRYRYDREIEAAERPALRKICERDDLSSRRLVLCVSAVYPDPSPSSEGGGASSEQHYDPPSVLVTDGWYSLPAILDPPLKYMVRCGRIAVGTKVITHGAELVGPSDPCHPLEAPPDLCLRLSANATRRTRWFTRLGYQACPHPFHIPLASVFSDGGTVGCTEAVIARVYPLIYMEKADDGRNVFRNSRTEERASQLWQELRQRKIEAISSRIQQDFEEEIACQEQSCGSWRRSHRLNTLQVKQLQDGQAIHSALKNSPDPQAFQEVLSAMQLALLESYQQSLVDSRQTELRHRIEQAVRREEEEGRLTRVRTSLPLLRVRLVSPGPGHTSLDCRLSVWRPREDVRVVLVEGRVVRIWNVNTSSNKKNKSNCVQLSASRSTRFQTVDMDHITMETALVGYHRRECMSIGRLGMGEGEGVWYGEVDTVGIVVCVTSEHREGQTHDGSTHQVDTVYLADSEGHVMAARVWEGLQHHALQGLLTPAALVSATSLTYRGHNTSGVVITNAGDHTHFSQAPSEPHMREGLRQLKESLPGNIQHYLHSLKEDINIYLQ